MRTRRRGSVSGGFDDEAMELGPAAYANINDIALPTTAYVPLSVRAAQAALAMRPSLSSRPRPRASRLPTAVGRLPAGRHVCLTERPVRVTSTTTQDLRLALDVLAYDEVTLMLRILNQEGTPGVTVAIRSGMQIETDTTWSEVRDFGNVASTNAAVLTTVTAHLRYLRWAVKTLTATAATFVIEGIGRSWSRG